MPGACIAGMHLSEPLISDYEGVETIVPFCDPVIDTAWMLKSTRFYPFYQNFSTSMIGTAYLCLNDPEGQPESPLRLLDVAHDYLSHWQEHSIALAQRHGAIIKGKEPGDIEISKGWLQHMLELTSPKVKEKLLEIAYR